MALITRTSVFLICLICLSGAGSSLSGNENEAGKNWNNFRGPTGNGMSTTAKPPTEWTSDKNVKWKIEIPGRGSSSPVVWGNKIFLTTAVNAEPNAKRPPQMTRSDFIRQFDENKNGQLEREEIKKARAFQKEQTAKSLAKHQFTVMCIDREDGKILWQDVANEKKPGESHHRDHGFATASPLTDGKHVYFHFGPNGMFCYDLDGKQVWKRTDLGEMETRGNFGAGSSLALDGDVLVMPWDHEGQSRIEAFNAKTGETIWKTERDEPSNWATPRIVEVNGKKQVVHAGDLYSRGYDLADGKELWRSSGLSSRPVATPIVKGNIGFFASSRQGSVLDAYYLDREGDISGESAWSINDKTPDCPSMLLSDNRLFFIAANRGIVSCANADDGSLFFGAQRLPTIESVYSSPVAANGKVFITGRQGNTVVIKDGNDYEIVAENNVGEPVDATLALMENQIFIRGSKHLFCIEEE